MNISKPRAKLTSTLVDLSITLARLISRHAIYKQILYAGAAFVRRLNISIPLTIMTCTSVDLSITLARLTTRQIIIKCSFMLVLDLPLYEHIYFLGNTDIYACETQYYPGKTYIKARGIYK